MAFDTRRFLWDFGHFTSLRLEEVVVSMRDLKPTKILIARLYATHVLHTWPAMTSPPPAEEFSKTPLIHSAPHVFLVLNAIAPRFMPSPPPSGQNLPPRPRYPLNSRLFLLQRPPMLRPPQRSPFAPPLHAINLLQHPGRLHRRPPPRRRRHPPPARQP